MDFRITAIHEMDERASSAARLAGVMGIAHAILVSLSLYLIQTRSPGLDASVEEITAFQTNEEDRRAILLVTFYLMPFAAITFIWFVNAFRSWVQRKTGIHRSTAFNVQLYASVGYVILTLAAAAAIAVTPAMAEFYDGQYDDVTSRLFPQLGQLLFIVMAMKMVSMTAMTTSSIGRVTGILPSWLNWLSLGAGIVLILVPTVSNWLFLVFALWLVIFSLVLLMKSQDPDLESGVATKN